MLLFPFQVYRFWTLKIWVEKQLMGRKKTPENRKREGNGTEMILMFEPAQKWLIKINAVKTSFPSVPGPPLKPVPQDGQRPYPVACTATFRQKC